MKTCEQCGGEFEPREAKQRFCCRACSDEWYQAERRQAVKAFREAGLKPAKPEMEQRESA